MTSRPRSAPFSTHARGVPLFDRARFFDAPRQAQTALLDLRDIGSSGFWFLSMQSWFTIWSLLVNIVAVAFFTYYHADSNRLAADLDFTLISFTVVLPLLGFTWIAYNRREQCLALLSECRCIISSILALHTNANKTGTGMMISAGGVSPLNQTQSAIATIVSAMRSYFLPSRFYSRNYPYLGYKRAMIQIALDGAKSQRQIKESLTILTAATCSASQASYISEALEITLHDRILRLSVVIDQLSNVKEFGTPQGIRSIARFYICLIIPLFFAPYWSWVSDFTNFAVAFFISIFVQFALVGLMNVAIALEDPFDNSGMDGIFIDEQLYAVEQALLSSGASSDVLRVSSGGLPTDANGQFSSGTQQQEDTNNRSNENNRISTSNTERNQNAGIGQETGDVMRAQAPPARVVRVATDAV